MSFQSLFKMLWIFHCHRPNDHRSGTQLEFGFNILRGADSSPNLNRDVQRGDDLSDGFMIFSATPEGTIKIHQMEPVGSCFLKFQGLTNGIIRINGFLLFLTLKKTDAFPLFQVDCGYQQHFSMISLGRGETNIIIIDILLIKTNERVRAGLLFE
jgi:hypothetical protein